MPVMATVLLFHHAQGQTPGFLTFVADLRAAGHTVHAPDLYDDRTFRDLSEGVAYAEQIGFPEIIRRGSDAAKELPADIVYAGFSLGVLPAQALAQTRPGARGALLFQMGIPFTHVDTSDSVEGWKARDIPSLGDIRSLGLITLGRFRSSTRGLAAKRRAVSISGGFAGRMALSAPTARPWASRGECRAACCAVEPAIGRYR